MEHLARQCPAGAGGRFAAIFNKVSRSWQRVNNNLAQSTATLPVADIIDKPLDDAVIDIVSNRAMTAMEKYAAINQIGALRSSLKQGLGDDISLVEAEKLKQQIGDRVNWGGATAVTDEVKPAYKQVYATIKNAINDGGGTHSTAPSGGGYFQAAAQSMNMMRQKADQAHKRRDNPHGKPLTLTRARFVGYFRYLYLAR